MTHDGLRNLVVTAEHAAGPWSDPLPIDAIGGDDAFDWFDYEPLAE